MDFGVLLDFCASLCESYLNHIIQVNEVYNIVFKFFDASGIFLCTNCQILVVTQVFFLVILAVQKTDGSDIYVAGNGEDRSNCGKTQETPCKTLDGALTRASDGDAILLDGLIGWDTSQFCKVRSPT